MQGLASLVNMEVPPPNKGCSDVYPQEIYKCMLSENLVKFIYSPFFLIGSLYDTWQLPNILQVPCMQGANPSLNNCLMAEMDEITAFRNKTADVLNKGVASPGLEKSCIRPSLSFPRAASFRQRC